MEHIIWKQKKGYAVGITSCGDLFLGYVDRGCEYFKDTEANREFVMSQWELNKRFA